MFIELPLNYHWIAIELCYIWLAILGTPETWAFSGIKQRFEQFSKFVLIAKQSIVSCIWKTTLAHCKFSSNLPQVFAPCTSYVKISVITIRRSVLLPFAPHFFILILFLSFSCDVVWVTALCRVPPLQSASVFTPETIVSISCQNWITKDRLATVWDCGAADKTTTTIKVAAPVAPVAHSSCQNISQGTVTVCVADNDNEKET